MFSMADRTRAPCSESCFLYIEASNASRENLSIMYTTTAS